MKPIIITVVAFVAGLGGATGLVAIRERDTLVELQHEQEAADRASRAQATAELVAPADSVESQAEQVEDEAVEDAEPEAEGNPAPAAAEEPGDTASTRAQPSRPRARTTASQPPEDSDSLDMFGFSNEGSRRLAKIFSAMKAQDAAAVLGGLENNAIQAILLQMGDRKAAEILANLDPERAASLSKNVLSSGGRS